jgi:DNA repair protein RadA/Sms
MVLAVLEAHGGLRLGMHDVYLNVAGGLRITEPAADLAAAAALVSSLSGSPLPPDTVYFGELGLSGAIRPVAQAPARLKEAAKLGFARAVAPAARQDRRDAKGERPALDSAAIGHITDLVAGIAAERPRPKPVLHRREG